MNLKYKAEMFDGRILDGLVSRSYAANMAQAIYDAHEEQRLKDAPVVYGRLGKTTADFSSEGLGTNNTHKARLSDIGEL